MVEQEYPPGKELGSVELFTANILQQPSGHDHGMDKFLLPHVYVSRYFS